MNLLLKNPFVRKGVAQLKKIPRFMIRRSAVPELFASNPPVLCNSFPKSGTHLIKQVLSVLPEIKDYGAFIATQPTISVRKRSLSNLRSKINKIVPGELICSHLEYDASLDTALNEMNVVHYFIYRDLRDVVVSESYYLAHMNRWHRLHKVYANLTDMEARNSLCINGGSIQDGLPYDYQNIGDRFRNYSGWISSGQCYAIRFEDLIGPDKKECVRGILEHYLRLSEKQADMDELVALALEAIQPKKSHTFREGRSGGWKDKLTRAQQQDVIRVAGNELKMLGYPVE